MQKVEILCNNGCGRAGEVEGEGVLDGSEIVELEDEIFGEMCLVTPDDPADADVCETELVTT